MSEINNKVKEIIVDKLGVSMNDIEDDSNFTVDLGADSLDTVELIMEFEREFGMQIPDEDAEKIATVKEAVEYISKNKSK